MLGLGAKLFTLSGPVIVYGIVTSILYGVLYYFTGTGRIDRSSIRSNFHRKENPLCPSLLAEAPLL